ncbi:MAG: DUF4129 domain-containing protein [Armatimonadota bacterium]
MRLLRLLSILACLLAACAATAATQGEYARVLSDLEARLSSALSAEKKRTGNGTASLDRALAGLPSAMKVGEVRADLSELRREVSDARWSKGKKRLGRISAALGEVRAMSGAATFHGRAPSGDARAALGKVLSGREYRHMEEMSWFNRMLASLLMKIGEGISLVPGEVWEVIGWVFLGIAACVFLVVLALLVRELVRRKERPVARETRRRLRVRKPSRPTPESLLAEAERDAGEGRYREAFRRAYLGSVLLLDRARLIDYTESGTNWEYTRAFTRRGPEGDASAFQTLTLLFDQIIYGRRSATEADYRSCLEQYRRMEGLAP